MTRSDMHRIAQRRIASNARPTHLSRLLRPSTYWCALADLSHVHNLLLVGLSHPDDSSYSFLTDTRGGAIEAPGRTSPRHLRTSNEPLPCPARRTLATFPETPLASPPSFDGLGFNTRTCGAAVPPLSTYS